MAYEDIDPGYGEPVVSRWGGQPTGIGGPENLSTPLIVLLHGDGATQDSMVRLAPHLPFGPAYAAVRGPVRAGATGYGWSTGTAGVTASMSWVMDWLDTEGDPERPVILVGFGGGATLAAGLLLIRPERWAGAVLLFGALPVDAGIATPRGRLIGIPVFLGGGADDVTREYLVRDSGAPVRVERAPAGPELSPAMVGEVTTWLDERLVFLGAQGENPLPDGADQQWPTLPGGTLAANDDGPQPDGKPVVLPVALAYDAVAKGWAVADPRAGLTLPVGAVLVTDRTEPADAVTAYAIIAAAHLVT